MASRKTETTISEEQKKALMRVVHFQGSASKSFVYFSGCQRPENRLEKLYKSNGRFIQPNAWEIETRTWLISRLLWALYQNSYCLKSSTEDSETIQQSRTSGRSSTAVEKVTLKPHCIFCNREGQVKIKGKAIWTTEATAVFEYQGWKTVLETAEIKGTRSFYGGSEVLIYLHVKHVFTAAVAGSVRETPLS